LTGFTSAFFSTLAGAEAGVAGALAGSAAKAVAAKAEAIKVAINFMIFPFWLSRNFYPYIYI
jgi:hypothetical protein